LLLLEEELLPLLLSGQGRKRRRTIKALLKVQLIGAHSATDLRKAST